MLTKSQFECLYFLYREQYTNQREMGEKLNFSLGKTNELLSEAKKNGWIGADNKLTQAGLSMLEPHKVTNAIIMAAGMSSRFVPISLEKPKGLLEVKGEVLIERQIRQLKASGITDITIVLGYKKESFFYLEDKFSVKIIINPLYNVKNNIETLFLAKEALSNTYICSSDDYFTENVFDSYVYQSYYSAVHVHEKTNEWYMIPDAKGNCKQVCKSGEDGYIMLGHVYWNRDFSEKFKALICEHRQLGDYDANLWEDLFADNIKKLPPMEIKEYAPEVIHEFDSLDELREFDERYISDSHSKIMQNICSFLGCTESDIQGLKPIKKGITNNSFIFEVNGRRYVYRHPGEGTEMIINRHHECRALMLAKEYSADPTFLTMDPDEGWKISDYVDNARMPVYTDLEDSRRVVAVMKKLHQRKGIVDWEFDPWAEAEKLEEYLRSNHSILLQDFDELKANVRQCYESTLGDGVEKCFCHCDTYGPNWMLTDSETILIDWEYAGMADPGCDVGGYIMDAMYTTEDGESFIREYIGSDDPVLLNHYIAYTSIISYYWFVWALYKESCGGILGESLHNWYVVAKRYANHLIKRNEELK